MSEELRMCPFCGSKLEYEDLLEITSDQIVAASNQRALTPPTATQEPVADAWRWKVGESYRYASDPSTVMMWSDARPVEALYLHPPSPPAPRREVTVAQIHALDGWNHDAGSHMTVEEFRAEIIKLFEDKP